MDGNTLTSLLKKPAVLFLGQQYLGRDQSDNELFSFYSILNDKKDLYLKRGWLQDPMPLELRAERLISASKKVAGSESILKEMQLPWKAVYTTCIDTVARRLLEVSGVRAVQPTTVRREVAPTANFLPLYYLFGAIEQPELPPGTEDALLDGRHSAVNLLRALSETVTPDGVLLIEGWSRTDWLRPRDLAEAFHGMLPGQVYIFGLTPEDKSTLEADEDFKRYIDNKIVEIEPATLQDSIRLSVEDGTFDETLLKLPTDLPENYEVLRRTPKADSEFLTVPWNRLDLDRLSLTFQVLRPMDPGRPLPDLLEERSDHLRNFMGNGFRSVPWHWLEELACPRPILESLLQDANRVAARPSPQDRTLVLYGQAGSGKSVALQLLCLRLRRQGYAVLYVGPGLIGPNLYHVDEFTQTLEAAGSAAPVFLVVDATARPDDYMDMSRFFQGRGRKVIVVGSAYIFQRPGKQEERLTERKKVIESRTLPISVIKDDVTKITTHLSSFIPGICDFAEQLENAETANFFALIYGLLPDSRGPLRERQLREILVGSDHIVATIAATPPDEEVGRTLMATRFQEALQYLQTDFKNSVAAVEIPKNLNATEVSGIFDAVFLCSSINAPLPQSLLFRLLKRSNLAYKCLMATGCIVPTEEGDTTLIKARTSLEALCYIQSTLSDPRDKLARLKRILDKIEGPDLFRNDGISEFVLKLLQGMGPQEDRVPLLPKRYFVALALIVTELKSRVGGLPYPMLLFHSKVIRESVKAEPADPNTNSRLGQLADWFERLREAEDSLDSAGRALSSPDGRLFGSARKRATLATERACLYGTRLRCILKVFTPEAIASAPRQKEISGYYDSARNAWLESLRYDDSNFHAMDAACWICSTRWQLGGLPEASKAILLADWEEMIDRSRDLELTPQQAERCTRKEADFASALDNPERFKEVLENASEEGVLAARVIYARYLRRNKGADEARKDLEGKCERSLLTERTLLVFYTRLWWEVETGDQDYFPDYARGVPFSEGQWHRWKELNIALLQCENERENGRAIFFKALALLHLGDTQGANTQFQILERLNVGGTRRSRALFLYSDNKGVPRLCRGEFSGKPLNNGKLPIWCEELGCKIPLDPIVFNLSRSLRPGEAIPQFHVAINYRGLYAEHPRFYKGHHA